MSKETDVATDIELFLKFLPHSATEESVWAHYKPGAPSLKRVRLSKNKETGECKGIGWLTIREEEDARRLVEKWNGGAKCQMEDRAVEISYAAEAGGNANWKPNGVAVAGSAFKCRFGSTCRRADCTFSHPEGWDPKSAANSVGDSRFDRPCNFGENCSRADCKFQHPEGRAGLQAAIGWKIRSCKFGWNCKFQACIYSHPDGRECDYAEPSEPRKAGKVSPAEETKPTKKKKAKDTPAKETFEDADHTSATTRMATVKNISGEESKQARLKKVKKTFAEHAHESDHQVPEKELNSTVVGELLGPKRKKTANGKAHPHNAAQIEAPSLKKKKKRTSVTEHVDAIAAGQLEVQSAIDPVTPANRKRQLKRRPSEEHCDVQAAADVPEPTIGKRKLKHRAGDIAVASLNEPRVKKKKLKAGAG